MKNSIYILLAMFILISCSKDESTNNNGNSDPSGPTLPEEFQSLAGIFDGEGVGAAVNLSEDILLIFNSEGTKYAWFEDQEIKATIELGSAESHFNGNDLEEIGASTLLYDGRIYTIDGNGEEYQAGSLPTDPDEIEGQWNNPDLISWDGNRYQLYQWGDDNSCPFTTVSAMWNFSYPGSGCFDASLNNNEIWMVNGAGDEVTRYYYPSPYFYDEMDLEDWTAENNCGGPDGLIPFDNISAACRYVKANAIQEIFFSGDGTQFCFYSVSEGIFSDIYDLY